MCADPIETYRLAGELGIDTILTSGQKRECLMGMPLLKELCGMQKEAGMPRIMAGAGVTPDVIRQFCEQTDITSYHLSAKKVLDSGMLYRKEDVPMGLPVMDEYSIFMTDSSVVAEAKKVLLEHMADS